MSPADINTLVPNSTPSSSDALDYINNLLNTYGLSSESAWAWGEIVGGSSAAQVQQDLRARPAWQQRFAAITQRASKGLPPISEADVINYENQATQLLRQAGAPPSFYNDPSDFVNAISNDVSINEFQQRVNTEQQKVAQTPPEVRAAYQSYFGIQGDSALLATYLDPDKSLPVLEKMANEAQFGGTGARLGFSGIGEGLAAQAADAGVVNATTDNTFAGLATQKGLTNATIHEDPNALTQDQYIAGGFGLSADAAKATRDRLMQRQAALSGTNDTTITAAGAIGLGTSRQGKR